MDKNYKPIKSMKEVPEQLRKLRRQYLRYQQAEINTGLLDTGWNAQCESDRLRTDIGRFMG